MVGNAGPPLPSTSGHGAAHGLSTSASGGARSVVDREDIGGEGLGNEMITDEIGAPMIMHAFGILRRCSAPRWTTTASHATPATA